MPRQVAAAALLLLAFVFVLAPSLVPTSPHEPGGFSLRGKFIGPRAGEDAAAVACLCVEVADCIEWDGQQTEPLLKTGTQFAELRRRARELRLHSESIGARQPHVREAIKAYLDAEVGVDGGEADDAARARWVTAFRQIGRAAADALQ